MADSNRSEPSIDLLSLPYRDRQLIVVVEEAKNKVERVDIRLRDYYPTDAKDLNPSRWFRKEYWTDMRNFGLIGYLIDRAKGGQPLDETAVRYLRKVQADLAERLLKFPPGHPLYDTVYVGHPLEPPTYVPMAGFHRFLFEEKFNELLTLLWSLGAQNATINYLRGYSDTFGAEGKLSLPADLPIDVKGSFQRKSSHRSEAILNAEFIPRGEPHVPESMAWYPYEPTWQRIAEARLSGRLSTIDVELRYEDDYGVSLELAAELSALGFKIGGKFDKYEQTVWKIQGSFS